MGKEIHASNGKAQACTQGALLVFLLSLNGKDFFSFFDGSQCVPNGFLLGSQYVPLVYDGGS